MSVVTYQHMYNILIIFVPTYIPMQSTYVYLKRAIA